MLEEILRLKVSKGIQHACLCCSGLQRKYRYMVYRYTDYRVYSVYNNYFIMAVAVCYIMHLFMIHDLCTL